MQRSTMYIFYGFCATLFIVLHSANAIPFYPSGYSNSRHKDYLVEIEDPDAVLDMLARLGQSILRAQHEGSNSKRGLDLGLGRGFSGSQAAKHLMGLAAANFAAGPGKKKRGGEEGMIELSNPELLNYRSSSPILVQDLMSASPNSNENDGWMTGGSRKE